MHAKYEYIEKFYSIILCTIPPPYEYVIILSQRQSPLVPPMQHFHPARENVMIIIIIRLKVLFMAFKKQLLFLSKFGPICSAYPLVRT